MVPWTNLPIQQQKSTWKKFKKEEKKQQQQHSMYQYHTKSGLISDLMCFPQNYYLSFSTPTTWEVSQPRIDPLQRAAVTYILLKINRNVLLCFKRLFNFLWFDGEAFDNEIKKKLSPTTKSRLWNKQWKKRKKEIRC